MKNIEFKKGDRIDYFGDGDVRVGVEILNVDSQQHYYNDGNVVSKSFVINTFTLKDGDEVFKTVEEGRFKKCSEFNCMNCGENFWSSYKVEICCDGRGCGCMGLPIEPVVCSEKCFNELTF